VENPFCFSSAPSFPLLSLVRAGCIVFRVTGNLSFFFCGTRSVGAMVVGLHVRWVVRCMIRRSSRGPLPAFRGINGCLFVLYTARLSLSLDLSIYPTLRRLFTRSTVLA